MKKPTKKLSLVTHTIRDLQLAELAHVNGGTISVQSGTPSLTPSGGIPSLNPSGGIPSLNPSGGRH